VHLERKTVLPSELENKLVEYCIIMDQCYYGLRRQDIKRMAFQLAIRNVLKHSFNQKKFRSWEEIASILFTKAFSNIYENSCRHFCSSGERLYMRKRRKVFDIYESELRKVNHPVYRIFNADKTGIITVQHRNSKVVSVRGKKEVASLTSTVLSPL